MSRALAGFGSAVGMLGGSWLGSTVAIGSGPPRTKRAFKASLMGSTIGSMLGAIAGAAFGAGCPEPPPTQSIALPVRFP